MRRTYSVKDKHGNRYPMFIVINENLYPVFYDEIGEIFAWDNDFFKVGPKEFAFCAEGSEMYKKYANS